MATNVGAYVSDEVVHATMLAHLNSLARGNSAISLEKFNKYIAIYNSGIKPCIPEKSSFGTSDDLGPLACIVLVCCGKWKENIRERL